MRNVGILAALSTMRGLGFSTVWIFTALYLRTVLGLTILEDGLIITAASALAALVQMYGGVLSDRFGYRRTIIFSMLFSSLLFSVLVISPSARSSQVVYPVLFVLLMVANTMQAPAVNALVSISSEVKLKGFSILRIGNNIGWGFGPAIGGFLISANGYLLLFIFGTVASTVALLLSLFLTDEKASERSHQPLRTENRLLILLSVVALLLFMVQAQETITLSNYARIIRNLGFDSIGLIYLTNGLAVIATQGFIYKISKKIGNFYSYSIGTLFYSAGFFSYSLATNLQGMLLATLVLTIGEDFAFPSGTTMVSLISKPENIGRNMGIYTSFVSAGRAVGPIIGGLALTYSTNPSIVWGLTTASGFISLIIFIWIFRKVDAIKEEAPQKVAA